MRSCSKRLKGQAILKGFVQCAICLFIFWILIIVFFLQGGFGHFTFGAPSFHPLDDFVNKNTFSAEARKNIPGSAESFKNAIKDFKETSTTTTTTTTTTKKIQIEDIVTVQTEDRVIIYEKKNCKGAKQVVETDNKEKNCEQCFDFCTQNFDNGRDLQDAKSIQIFGKTMGATLNSRCHGHWSYATGGYVTSILAEDKCVNLENFASVANLNFFNIKDSDADVLPDWVALDDPKNEEEIFKRLKYWEYVQGKPHEPAAIKSKLPIVNKYTTFYQDCGGFNNIRMGFEHAILMAWFSDRTLVLPPDAPWYLIDFGPFHNGKVGGASGVTSYGDYFDIEDLKKGVPTLSAQEFAVVESDLPGMKEEFKNMTKMKPAWKTMLESQKHDMRWSPLHVAILYPTIGEFEANAPEGVKRLAGQRQKVELTEEHKSWKIMHYPSCAKNHAKDQFRYLGQIAASVLFAEKEKEIEFKLFLRNHVHFKSLIFEIASKIIKKLGMFEYSSFHIRRNDLQYKESFQSAGNTLKHAERLLKPNEVLYIATDETNAGFFDAMQEHHKVYRWGDFIDDKDLQIDGLKIPAKLIGCIEQVVCAGGRRFFGTKSSTFTSYIFRLRGYIGAPDTNEYWHNTRYVGISDVDNLSQPTGANKEGVDYMLEYPGLWNDLMEH